jgi:hypothetical protein
VLEGALEEAEETRRAGERETARRAEETAAREKEKARLRAIEGLTANEIAKAEELANWDFMKDSRNPQDFRDHVARFQRGVTNHMAWTRLEALLGGGLGAAPGIDDLQAFLAEFPSGPHAREALLRRDALADEIQAAQLSAALKHQEEAAWEAANRTGTRQAFQTFLDASPSSPNADKARAEIQQLTRRYVTLAIVVVLFSLAMLVMIAVPYVNN